MIAALTQTKGMVYLAAALIGCDPDTIHIRARTSAGVRNAIRRERGKVVDTAELKLASAIENGEPWAIQMCLKTLGRDRGYVEKPADPAAARPPYSPEQQRHYLQDADGPQIVLPDEP